MGIEIAWEDILGEDKTDMLIICGACDKSFIIIMPTIEHYNWYNGMLIQDAMPSISKEERELIISSTCDECWSTMWGEK